MLNFFLELLQTPSITLALVAMIGLILQKESLSNTLSGTVKTALGMLILSFGAGIIVSEILPLAEMFPVVFNLEGFATSSEAVVGAIQNEIMVIASTSSLIMAFGFLTNVLLARITPLKYVFLTGHMMWILSVALAFVFYDAGYNETTIIVLGSITQGLLLTLLPAISQPIVRKVTGSDAFAIAHLTTIGTVASGYIGGLVGNKENDTEDLELPESLDFFRDTAMSVFIIMGIFYLTLVLVAGPEFVSEYAGGQNYIVFGLLKALGFTAGILILLQGVRMFLGELVPAFKGISDKLVPGAIPALDVPALFQAAPNALMIGFIFAIIGMMIGMFTSSIVFGVIPLISIIGAFFTGGVSGIFGNATGGRRGAAVAGTVYGFLLIFGSAFLSTLYNFAEYGAAGIGHDTIDVMVSLSILKNPIFGIIIIVAVFIIYSVLEVRRTRRIAVKS